MGLPCPVCGRNIKEGEKARTFPNPRTSKRQDYCMALDVPRTTFDHIKTRRKMCFSHFDEEDFVYTCGRRVLKHDAYPKELTAEEKSFLLNSDFNKPRFRQHYVKTYAAPPHVRKDYLKKFAPHVHRRPDSSEGNEEDCEDCSQLQTVQMSAPGFTIKILSPANDQPSTSEANDDCFRMLEKSDDIKNVQKSSMSFNEQFIKQEPSELSTYECNGTNLSSPLKEGDGTNLSSLEDPLPSTSETSAEANTECSEIVQALRRSKRQLIKQEAIEPPSTNSIKVLSPRPNFYTRPHVTTLPTRQHVTIVPTRPLVTIQPITTKAKNDFAMRKIQKEMGIPSNTNFILSRCLQSMSGDKDESTEAETNANVPKLQFKNVLNQYKKWRKT